MEENENKIKYIEENLEADSKIKKLRKILKRCKSERQEYLLGWQRARADFQNYIKQKDGEIRDARKFAAEDVVLQIIPIFDNLILARKSIPVEVEDSAWAKGILSVTRQFEGVLHELGVEEITIKKGDKFDPAYAEAIEDVASEGESGTIVEILQKGYMLHGKVIRVARVKIIK